MSWRAAQLALLLAASCATTQAIGDDDGRLYLQRLAEAVAATDRTDHARAGMLFPALIGDSRFESLPAADRVALLSKAAWSAYATRQLSPARDFYARATELGSEDPDDWYRLALVQADLGDLDASARALTVLVERWPELLRNLDQEVLYPVALRGDGEPSPDRIAYMQALFDANWDGGDGAAGLVWLRLASAALDSGDGGRARATLRRIHSPDPMIALRADRRFDGLYDPQGWPERVHRAAIREADRLRLRVASRPAELSPRVQLGYALLALDRNEELLALADDSIAAITSAGVLDAPFTDLHDQVWMMNHRADALRRLGRLDEALDTLRRASQLGEHAGENVSQRLNLGAMLCSMGRADDAEAAIATDGALSGYGRMVQASVRQCIALARGDRDGARAALDYLDAHRADAPLLHVLALVEDGQPEPAVAAARQMLQSEPGRRELLDWMQELQESAPLPGDRVYRQRRAAFRARPDLLAAVEEVGRIEHYPLHRATTR